MTTAILMLASLVFANADRPPNNFVLLFADDLGYGDLGCYGHPTIRTPNLDRMAREGVRFTQFYSGAPVCTPSRAALLTGRLPVRSGLCDNRFRVLFPFSEGGIPDEEITLAEILKGKGYATMCIGKWHLGHLPRYLPTRHGFDRYFGIPYSNDMAGGRHHFPPIPLLRGEETIESPADQTTLTRRYTQEAEKFIAEHREKPFLLYLAHTFPHVPLAASEEFLGKSPRGLYGDVVEEIDASVGRILEKIRELGLAERTLVFFTSDNGPWRERGLEGGSAGLLRDGKGSTFEGGMRVPGIAWQPGRIPAGRTTRAIGSVLDLLPTCAEWAGAEVPTDRPIDGVSLTPALETAGPGKRETLFYWRGTRLMAVRKGPWKAHLRTQPAYGERTDVTEHDPPLLFHLDQDPGEEHDVAARNPGVVEELREEARRHLDSVVAAPSQLTTIRRPPAAKQ